MPSTILRTLNDDLVRVQALVSSGAEKLLKRFAEAARDSIRAGAPSPTLPGDVDIGSPSDTPVNVPLIRTSVHVPRSAAAAVRAYARQLRRASRDGVRLPKFELSLPPVQARTTPMSGSIPSARTTEPAPRDIARIREGMRVAREARNV